MPVQGFLPQPPQIRSVIADLSPLRQVDSQQQLHQRGLPAPVGPHQRHHLPLPNRQGDGFHCLFPAMGIPEADILQFNGPDGLRKLQKPLLFRGAVIYKSKIVRRQPQEARDFSQGAEEVPHHVLDAGECHQARAEHRGGYHALPEQPQAEGHAREVAQGLYGIAEQVITALFPVQPPLGLIHAVPLLLPSVCQVAVEAHDPHLLHVSRTGEQGPYIVPLPLPSGDCLLQAIALPLQQPVGQEELGHAGSGDDREQGMVCPQGGQQREDACNGCGQDDQQHEDSGDAVVLHAFLGPFPADKHLPVLKPDQGEPGCSLGQVVLQQEHGLLVDACIDAYAGEGAQDVICNEIKYNNS